MINITNFQFFLKTAPIATMKYGRQISHMNNLGQKIFSAYFINSEMSKIMKKKYYLTIFRIFLEFCYVETAFAGII